MKIEPRLLSPEELKKISVVTGRKLALNAEVYVGQLLGHIAALTGKKATGGKNENAPATE